MVYKMSWVYSWKGGWNACNNSLPMDLKMHDWIIRGKTAPWIWLRVGVMSFGLQAYLFYQQYLLVVFLLKRIIMYHHIKTEKLVVRISSRLFLWEQHYCWLYPYSCCLLTILRHRCWIHPGHSWSAVLRCNTDALLCWSVSHNDPTEAASA